MDVALNLEQLVSGAKYRGSLTPNTPEAYEAIVWEDERPKPTWGDLQKAPTPPLPVLDQLKAVFAALPLETQAAFGPLAAAVFMFLTQNNPAAAKLVIQQADIPAELEDLRTQMLAAFP